MWTTWAEPTTCAGGGNRRGTPHPGPAGRGSIDRRSPGRTAGAGTLGWLSPWLVDRSVARSDLPTPISRSGLARPGRRHFRVRGLVQRRARGALPRAPGPTHGSEPRDAQAAPGRLDTVPTDRPKPASPRGRSRALPTRCFFQTPEYGFLSPPSANQGSTQNCWLDAFPVACLLHIRRCARARRRSGYFAGAGRRPRPRRGGTVRVFGRSPARKRKGAKRKRPASESRVLCVFFS